MPGTADRILSLAENEQKLRAAEFDGKLSLHQLRIGVSVAVSAGTITPAAWSFFLGYAWQAVLVGLAEVVPLFRTVR